MKVLIIGGGGREHALAWKIAQSPNVKKVFVAPGNAGTARERYVVNVPIADPRTLAAFATREQIDLTVVGPEAPLAAGIVDLFKARGMRIFGPTQAAAQLESSKDFAKQFLKRHNIPTARFETFSDPAQAHAYVEREGAPIVVKADGLAAGKGVVVAMTSDEAHAAIDHMLIDKSMGEAGARVVIEEFLEGEEASFIVLADGQHVLPLATSQDHKRLRDGDEGPNTGGMGAYSPAPVVTPSLYARIQREIIMPTIRGMASEGMPYTGFLYAGLMINANGDPRVLEYNCRLGDPETQPILIRLKSDLIELLSSALAGKLDQIEANWDRRTALGVVVAASGYPDAPRKGDTITGLPVASDDLVVFHAGTSLENDVVHTNGGRVLCVTALGDSVRTAQRRVYQALEGIHFDGMQYRRDIGHRALKRN